MGEPRVLSSFLLVLWNLICILSADWLLGYAAKTPFLKVFILNGKSITIDFLILPGCFILPPPRLTKSSTVFLGLV